MHSFDTTIQLASLRRAELIRTADRRHTTRTCTTNKVRRIARRARRSLLEEMS